MSHLTVSCIIPAFNAARFLGDALDSVFAQTHPVSEIIVVDDGSTDGTADVARSRDVIVIQQPNAGDIGARDAGLRVASAEHIAFLDADDLWAPHKIERQLTVLRGNPEIDLCLAHYQNFWDAEVAAEADRYRDHPLSAPLTAYSVPTLVARRSAFERFGTFTSENNPNDTAWFARAVKRGARIEMLPEVLLKRRLHGDNLSRRGEYSLNGLFELIRSRRGRT